MNTRFSIFTLSAALVLSMSVSAKVVSVNNAEIAAKNFLASKGMPTQELVLVKSNFDQAVLRAPLKDSNSPAFHIFSDRDKKEIIVVSGDDIARPILGFSFNYNADENGEIPPAMQDWLAEMERQISQARKQGVEQSAETARQWRAPAGGNVIKQLQTAKWGQNFPFNYDCPIYAGDKCITGCVATSYAILMKYYRYPSGATGYTQTYITRELGITVPSRNLSATYDWDSMLMDYSNGYNSDQAIAVAKLMADIGAAIQADYAVQETSARYEGGYIFKHFGYNLGTRSYKADYSVQDWNSMMKAQLDGNRPILYNASIEDNSAAHSFIIDGYTDQDYFCVNWGWAGNCDGAYALDAMIPYDNYYYTFTGRQCAYFDFKPALDMPAVARINDSIDCPSLEAAVAVIPEDGTPYKITMVGNGDIDELNIRNNQNIVLDLNGYKIGVVNYGIYNHGDLVIADSKSNGSMVFKIGTSAILNNYKNLTIYGGQFVNQVGAVTDDNYYRRCIWTERGSVTDIKAGKFKAICGVICTNGGLTIESGEFESTGNDAVISNYNTEDTVVIKGGTFQNMNTAGEGTNYRRVIWSCDESATHITGGVFTCKNPVILSKGDFIIDNGHFECVGNTSAIYNYSTTGKMTINGGVFVNSLGIKEPNDYRRAFYSIEGTQSEINGGKFSSASQVITVVGNLIINDATIEDTGNDGLGVLTGGSAKATINYCKLKAKTLVANSGAELKCYGGLYSKVVTSSFLGTGCKCVSNDDDATSSVYRYKVVNPSGIDDVIISTDAFDLHYDLNGMSAPDNNPGIHFIRTSDGRTIKVLYK